MAQTLHIYSGTFGSRENACQYSERQWEKPEPDDSWSDEEYSAWENRNPAWLLRRDLAVAFLDSDFIETIFGAEMIEYLDSQLTSDADRQKLRTEIPQQADTLVLIMSVALNGQKVSLSSTSPLQYHGEYAWRLSA